MKKLVLVLCGTILAAQVYVSDYSVQNTYTNGAVADADAITADFNAVSTASTTKLDETGGTMTGALTMDVGSNDIVTTANGDLDLTPNGTGDVNLFADTVAIGDLDTDVTLTTEGTGDLTLNTNAGTNSGSILIADGSSGDITIDPSSSGNIVMHNATTYFDSDGALIYTGAGVDTQGIEFHNSDNDVSVIYFQRIGSDDTDLTLLMADDPNNNIRFEFNDPSNSLEFYFASNGNGYADNSWTTFSPKIDKHMEKKGKKAKDATASDYLDWALEDAKKPAKPYDGISGKNELEHLEGNINKEKNKPDKNQEVIDELETKKGKLIELQTEYPDKTIQEIEIDLYGKDICRIAIGTAIWAEDAQAKLEELEARIEALE